MAVLSHAPRACVNLDSSKSNGLGRGRSRPLDSPKDCIDARHELADAKWFCHVVVRAHAKSNEHVGFGVTRGQHQHRDMLLGLNPPADLESIEGWKHYVEYDKIRIHPPADLDSGRPIHGNLDQEPFAREPGRYRLRNCGFVLDDNDLSLHKLQLRTHGLCVLSKLQRFETHDVKILPRVLLGHIPSPKEGRCRGTQHKRVCTEQQSRLRSRTSNDTQGLRLSRYEHGRVVGHKPRY
jgi:hypothetical protein